MDAVLHKTSIGDKMFKQKHNRITDCSVETKTITVLATKRTNYPLFHITIDDSMWSEFKSEFIKQKVKLDKHKHQPDNNEYLTRISDKQLLELMVFSSKIEVEY